MNIAMVEKPVLSAHAWRVTFKAPTTEADFGSLVPDAPRPFVAVREEFNVTDALDALTPKLESTEFVVIWAPPGATTVEHGVESWVGTPSPPLRASISTIRVLWSNNRAVLFCAAEAFESGYDAVVRFTVIMREVCSLDEQMADVWRSVNKHLHLVHASIARGKRKEVNQAYEKAVELKLMFLRTQTSLEQLSTKLDSTSKRLCAEMILAANLHDRLEMMENSIQFVNDHYEIVNTRLFESKNATRGMWLEGFIALLIAANTGAIWWGGEREPPELDRGVSISDTPAAMTRDKQLTSVNRADKKSAAQSTSAANTAASTSRNIIQPAPENLVANTTSATGEVGVNNTSIGPPSLIVTPLTTNLDAGACQAGLASLATGDKIRFNPGASSIQRSSSEALRLAASIVKRCRDVVIEVRGHANSSRDATTNLKVARGRAQAVVSYLRHEGVTTSLLRSVGVTAGEPIESKSSVNPDAKSGKIEFVVIQK